MTGRDEKLRKSKCSSDRKSNVQTCFNQPTYVKKLRRFSQKLLRRRSLGLGAHGRTCAAADASQRISAGGCSETFNTRPGPRLHPHAARFRAKCQLRSKHKMIRRVFVKGWKISHHGFLLENIYFMTNCAKNHNKIRGVWELFYSAEEFSRQGGGGWSWL